MKYVLLSTNNLKSIDDVLEFSRNKELQQELNSIFSFFSKDMSEVPCNSEFLLISKNVLNYIEKVNEMYKRFLDFKNHFNKYGLTLQSNIGKITFSSRDINILDKVLDYLKQYGDFREKNKNEFLNSKVMVCYTPLDNGYSDLEIKFY